MSDGAFNHRLSDFIVVIRNLVTREWCDHILHTYKDHPDWSWALTAGGLDLSHRKVRQMYISSDVVKQQDQRYAEMDAKVFDVISKAKDFYMNTLSEKRGMKYMPPVSSDEGYQILHYAEGYYFKEHCDDGVGMSRLLTCTLNLSDDHDGGLFRFLRGEFDVRLNAGDAVLFPSNFMFPHEITPITRGDRYSIVTWFR